MAVSTAALALAAADTSTAAADTVTAHDAAISSVVEASGMPDDGATYRLWMVKILAANNARLNFALQEIQATTHSIMQTIVGMRC